MLALDPDDRPDMKEVCEALKNKVRSAAAKGGDEADADIRTA